jgi:NAD(P)-dependent dehydrogenase (short-subunit alcohol dehydrogenase family)
LAKSRVAVVSGGNRGIGLEICRQLLANGVSVALGSRDDERGKKVAAALQEEVQPEVAKVASFPLEVTSQESVTRFANAVEGYFGSADILVNNAGIMIEPRDGSLLQTTPKMLRETLEVNLVGTAMMCQVFVPAMKARGYGRVVNLSSGLGQLERMGAGLPGYRISKTAINALTRTLAAELAGSGILVNAVSPGWVKTDMGGPNAERRVEEGAETAVWLCLLPSTGPTGGFFRDHKAIPW